MPDTPPPSIVGIGASAGGLEALETFFAHVPASSGFAFVVVQHLDPHHPSLLPELLQRCTPMPVVQAGQHMPVAADCVYIIPPNKDLALQGGKLLLLDPLTPRGQHLPIDGFFCSLAEDQHERAIGVILSGMGADGTLGLRAIKENAGLTLVQTPDSAKFDAMPRSAIDAGLADIIAPPHELPSRMAAYLHHAPPAQAETKPHSALAQIIALLQARNGNDFSLYKKNTIYRRIERRMGLHQIGSIALYASYLRENPGEIDLLFKELLIGVTSFFRDRAVWETLKREALPALLAAHPAGKALRAWVPACSTGEEAYSLAIAFCEVLTELKPAGRFTLQIFATDLDEDAITRARQGRYPALIESDVPPPQLARYFSKDEQGGYRIHKDIREMVIFAPQNIIMDPPFTKLDLLTCRNLLIYLGPELQKKLIPLFHYALTREGILMLGNAEAIGSFNHLFTAIDNQSRLFRRIDHPAPLAAVDFPTRVFPFSATPDDDSNQETPMSIPITNLQSLADQVLLQSFSPPAVLVNADGNILYINGRTGKFLEPAAGKANWNIYAMAREGLRPQLDIALQTAQGQSEPVFVPGITLDNNGLPLTVNLTVQAISTPEPLRGALMVVFTEVPTPAKLPRRATSAVQKELLEELQQAHQQIQTLREEMQASQEELKSANEELQSTNEELQSANEELTTSKEEMQSLNEELQTINAELQAKVDDLSWVNNDMQNLLNSTELATIFLDSALNVRRFTTHATHLFKLIPSDVGRPLSDIVTDLDYPQLQADSVEVLRTLVFVEKQLTTRDGRWFKVRIMPYRTHDNVITGVVMTFIDISAFKQLEAELRGRKQGA